MKREFLQTLKVGEMFLPKEVVDAIMEENGRDINAAKAAAVKPYADYDDIVAENGRLKTDVQMQMAEGKTAAQWKEAYDQATREYEMQLDNIDFRNTLEGMITSFGGRNTKAITALLEPDTLKASENRQTAIEEALKNLKAEAGYLFQTPTPPPYARGTGNRYNPNETAPTNLAGVLREKFERK